MISFVVPAYNEERLLGRTLAAIHAAARVLEHPYELVGRPRIEHVFDAKGGV